MNTSLSNLDSLPPDWRNWLQDNASRGCSAQSMLDLLITKGGFAPALAQVAVAQVLRMMPSTTVKARPDIIAQSNAIDIDGHKVNVLMTLQNPRVVLLGNVLTHEECDAFISLADARLKRSSVVEREDGIATLHAARTSVGAMFQRAETELNARFEQRLAKLCNWPVTQAEGLQVLRYEPGEEYRPHFDWFDPTKPGPRKHMEHGGQRVGTVVLYLSDVEEGGGTSFPTLGLEARPSKGGAIFFCDVDATGNPDEKTLHAGQPVVRGVKYIATKWMRERHY